MPRREALRPSSPLPWKAHGRHDHGVSSRSLRLIKSLVCQLQQPRRRRNPRDVGGDANADGDPDWLALGSRDGCRLDPFPNVLRHSRGSIGIGVGQKDRELLTANPRDKVVRSPHSLFHNPREEAQNLVPAAVAEAVVQLLEMVRVQGEERQRATGA